MSARVATALLAASLALLGATLPAQPASASPRQSSATPPVPGQAAIDAALKSRDFAKAEQLIARRVASGDRDPILLYNHACVLAQLGRLEEAEKQLLESVKAGFAEFDQMEADADLDPIRDGRTYTSIMEARERLLEKTVKRGPARPARRAAPDPLARWKDEHGDQYRYELVAERGLSFATYLDDASHKRMRELLERLERHLLKAYFEKPPEDPALIAIVRPEDAAKYLDKPEIRGMYLHRERRLVSRDTGQSLTHEFVHLLHFADMERRNQRHPIWIQEGLASLYEDYTLNEDGSVEFHPNIRFNIARKQVVSRTARDWRELFAMSGDRFMQDAERHYPQVRAIFEFFARERRLEAFYKALIETSREDLAGLDDGARRDRRPRLPRRRVARHHGRGCGRWRANPLLRDRVGGARGRTSGRRCDLLGRRDPRAQPRRTHARRRPPEARRSDRGPLPPRRRGPVRDGHASTARPMSGVSRGHRDPRATYTHSHAFDRTK